MFSPNNSDLSRFDSIRACFNFKFIEDMTNFLRVFVSEKWLSQRRRHASLRGFKIFCFDVSFDMTISVTAANADNAIPNWFCLYNRDASLFTKESCKAAFTSGLRAGDSNKSQLLGIKYSLRIFSFTSFDNPLARISCHLRATSLWIDGPSVVSVFGASPSNKRMSSSRIISPVLPSADVPGCDTSGGDGAVGGKTRSEAISGDTCGETGDVGTGSGDTGRDVA